MIDDILSLPIVGQIETEPVKKPIETSIDQELFRFEETDPAHIAEIGLKGGAFIKSYGKLRDVGRRRLVKAERLELDEERFFPAYVLGLVSDRGTKRLAFAHNADPTYTENRLLRFSVISTVKVDDVIAYITQVPKYRIDNPTYIKKVTLQPSLTQIHL